MNDPARASEIARAIGQGSPFEIEHGFYADALRPSIATLPEGWEQRLIRHTYDSGVVALYLHPDDAAVAKLARGETRDRRWVREGIAAGILSVSTIRLRMRSTDYLDQAEHDRAKANLASAQKAAAALLRRRSIVDSTQLPTTLSPKTRLPRSD